MILHDDGSYHVEVGGLTSDEAPPSTTGALRITPDPKPDLEKKKSAKPEGRSHGLSPLGLESRFGGKLLGI